MTLSLPSGRSINPKKTTKGEKEKTSKKRKDIPYLPEYKLTF